MLMSMSAWAGGHEESGPPVQIGNNFYYIFDDGAWLSFSCHEGFEGIWIRNTHCYSGDVVVPESVNGVTVVGIMHDTFAECELTSLQLPSTIKFIDYYAFGSCTCPEVRIPSSVDTIGYSVFNGCNFDKLILQDSNKPLVCIQDPFGGYETDNVNEVYMGRNIIWNTCRFLTAKKAIIGNSVTVLPNGLFSYNTNLESLTLGTGAKVIPQALCNGCHNLASITIPEGVTHIKADAFTSCRALASASFPSTLKVIEGGAFYGNNSLTSLTIPASVDTIYRNAFRSCPGIVNFTFEDGTKPIVLEETDPWHGIIDDSPLQQLHLGRKYIGGQLFKYRTLKSISFGDAIDEIPESAFNNCDSLTSITWGKGLKRIGKNAFNNCKALTTVIIPKSIVEIEESAFYNCSGITSLKLSNGLKTIGATAFNNIAVTILRIPATVETIGNYAFSCNTVQTVYNHSQIPPVCTNWAFYYNEPKTQATLYVPMGTKNAYQEAVCWKEFKNLQEVGLGNEACDVNGDNEVNIADVNSIISAILSGGSEVIIYDANDDGEVNIADVNAIIGRILSSI